jgi:hypothetical protein
MARRTVSGVGPSASVQVSGFCDAIPGGFQPHEAIIRPTNTSAAINRRTPQSYGRSKTRSIKACLVPGWGGYWRYDEILIMADVIGGQRERTNRRYQLRPSCAASSGSIVASNGGS